MGKVFKALTKAESTAGPEKDDIQAKIASESDSISEKSVSGFEKMEASTDTGTTVKTKPAVEKTAAVPDSVDVEKTKAGPESAVFSKSVDMGAAGQAWDERLVAVTGTSSPVAESFKRLRNKILHPSTGEPPKSILITSVVPEEGKSFVCANLGATMAQGLEQHALMVDCDFRRPSLAPLFGLSNDTGLVNYLRDGTDLSQLIQSVGFQKLSIIPSGPPPINPAELLDSGKMTAMIDEVVSRYGDRLVILDSPPVQAAAETAVLARHVDAVVLVIRWGQSRREQVKQLIELIGESKIIGIVFNAVKVSRVDERLSGRYYGGYGAYGEYGRKAGRPH
ncbi:MAG: CpsD/CapB family tyrosine-protein kinase [Thermodesulfobacteriota bacterium]|nr:CpsD/CapB family tyrosine-protein kinase [Thermodesulfobacteriota bacterium]